ncbi:hypothetical protein [Herbiconiux sp. UC225_62]|uniref:hypothetical protein n=1 Tax=Herbiconiux sp. UC225_62 TaxID=3350168 RepID=UPI0036D41B7F
MAASLERLDQVSTSHSAQQQSLILKLIKLLLGFWGDFDGWYDESLVIGQAARSATLVAAATRQARTLARSYTSITLADLDATPRTVPPMWDFYPRNGIGALEVYSRPAKQYVYARSQGATVEEAKKVANERLEHLATQDVKLATRDEERRIYEAAPKVIGYRRIVHPELSKSGTCGLCIVASARVYSTDDLMPLHGPSCNCDTLPITKGDDPGFRLNDDDLQKIYAAAGSTAAEDLQNTRISINEHGELGPVLVKKGDHFRSAADAGRPEYEKPTPETIRANYTAALDDAKSKLADIQDAYAELAAQPGAMDANSDLSVKRVALFRAQKFAAEHVAALTAGLANLPK